MRATGGGRRLAATSADPAADHLPLRPRSAPSQVPPFGRASNSRLRVLILSAGVGEGHETAAQALAGDLTREGADVRVADGLAALGALIQLVVRDGSRIQFQRFPSGFGPVYALLMHFAPVRWAANFVLYQLGSRSLLRLIAAHDPDVVVSTYPGVTAVLGRMRRRGRLRVPACTTILDLTSFPFWVHRGIDLHLVMHRGSLGAVAQMAGPDAVRLARPLVRADFLEPRERSSARRALGVPDDQRLVVVAGGGWGIGDLEGAVQVALELADARVVCVTGRNEILRHRLEREFAGQPRVEVLGFTEQMSDLLAAADALVHPGGGVTCLEALVRGCPTVVYAAPAGHWSANARAMESVGLAAQARSPRELADVLPRVTREARPPAPDRSLAPTAASLVMGAHRRKVEIPAWRLAMERTVAATAAAVLMVGWSFSSDDAYSLVAHRLHISPLTAVSTPQPRIGLVIRTPRGVAPIAAEHMAHRRLSASFAVVGTLPPQAMTSVTSSGQELLPELPEVKRAGWLTTRKVLRRQARSLRLPKHFFYLTPRGGTTLGEYALARSSGARPVNGAVRVDAGSALPAGLLHSGEIVVLTLRSPSDLPLLERFLAQARGQGLEPEPVGVLAAPAGSGSTGAPYGRSAA